MLPFGTGIINLDAKQCKPSELCDDVDDDVFVVAGLHSEVTSVRPHIPSLQIQLACCEKVSGHGKPRLAFNAYFECDGVQHPPSRTFTSFSGCITILEKQS